MSRPIKPFVASSRNKTQDEFAKKRLISRIFADGKTNCYHEVDYEQLKTAANLHKENTSKSEKKLAEIKARSRHGKNRNLAKNHAIIWKESYTHVMKQLHSISVDYRNMTKQLIENIGGNDEDLAVDIEMCLDESDDELNRFIAATVTPLQELIEDLKYRLKNLNDHGIGISGTEADETISQVTAVKGQSSNVIKLLEHQQNVLISDLKKSHNVDVTLNEFNKVYFLPSEGNTIPLEVVFGDCPDETLKKNIMKQFLTLRKNYDSRLKREYQSEPRQGNEETMFDWTAHESWLIKTVQNIYEAFIPAHMHSSMQSLCLDMLQRLMKNISKYKIIELQALYLRQKYSLNRKQILMTSYHKDMENLAGSALAAFAEARVAYRAQQSIAQENRQQRDICDKLHRKVEIMRQRQEEMLQIHQEIEEHHNMIKMHQEEQRKQRELSRREQMKNELNHYKDLKQKELNFQLRKKQERLRLLQDEMAKERLKNKQRVEFRHQLLQEKQERHLEAEREKMIEKAELELRLQRLRDQVSVAADFDPQRLVSDTIASRAHAGIGINEDVNLQAPLFALHGYSEQQINSDVRVRAEAALRKAGVHDTNYAREIISRMKPPTQPRPDNNSSAVQFVFSNSND